jgi:YD repeat-containing protein
MGPIASTDVMADHIVVTTDDGRQYRVNYDESGLPVVRSLSDDRPFTLDMIVRCDCGLTETGVFVEPPICKCGATPKMIGGNILLR